MTEKAKTEKTEKKGKKAKKGKRKTNPVFVIIMIIAIAILCYSGGRLGLYYWKTHSAQQAFRELQVNNQHDLVALHKKNSDLVGWIKIPDTKIDYPVMQTPNEPEFYLRKNFQKEYSIAGTPFMDALSVIGESKNYLIYGHNIKAGTMFHDLLKYEEKEFYEQHKTFTYDEYFDGTQLNGEYLVVAAFRTQIYEGDSNQFKYNEFAYINDQQTFEEYVKGIKALSYYDTGIEPQWGDQLVTLSTCAYHTDEGRYVVVGVKTSDLMDVE